MTTPETMAQEGALRALHQDIQRDADRILRDVEQQDLLRALAERVGRLPAVGQALDRLIARGYPLVGPEQRELGELNGEAAALSQRTRAEAQRLAAELRPRADVLVRKIRAIPAELAHEPSVRAISGDRDALETTFNARKAELETLVAPWQTRFDKVARRVQDQSEQLDLFEAAKFQLGAGEHPVSAVPATWDDHKEGEKPKGFLFFTNTRVRFEQREEISKKKFLFFTTDTEKVQRLLLDEPIGHLQRSEDSTRGMLIKDQMLSFVWAKESSVPGDKSTFEVDKGTAKDWDALVEDIRSGAIARLKPGVAAADASASAGSKPMKFATICTGCGSPLPPPVAGQARLSCPYCGTAHEVELA